MTALSPFVVLDRRESYAILRWDRTERKNGITTDMTNTMKYYLDLLAKDNKVNLVVITGTGDYYSSGADFLNTVVVQDGRPSEVTVREGLNPFRNLVRSFILFPKPIIAAVNGPAIGMAVSTLPLCDVVYASSDSTFLTPFSRIGMAPEACSSYTFPLVMGYAKANEMLLFNRTLSASEAKECGLVSEVFPKETLMNGVEKRVQEFLDNPAMCLVYGKQLIRGRDQEKLLKINDEELDRLVERGLSEDAVVQAMKFVQKRNEIKELKRAKL